MQVHVWLILSCAELRYNDVWAYTAHFISNKYTFQNSSSSKMQLCAHCWKMFHISMRGRVKSNQQQQTWHLTRQLAILEKYEISLRRKLLRASVCEWEHAWVLSTHLNNPLAALFFSRFPSLSSIRCDRTTFEISMCAVLHCIPIQLACLHKCIFLYRFDTFHFCYFSLLRLCFNLSICLVWYDTHLHLLVNQYKAYISKERKSICCHSFFVKQERR